MDYSLLPNDIPFENIPKGSSSLIYVDKLLTFLKTYLPSFIQERKVSSTQSENDLTEELYKHLTRKRKFNSEEIEYPFEFQPEKGQKNKKKKGHSKRTDIAARINTINFNMEVIYCLEAKKLPTGTSGSKREKEYLFGRMENGKYLSKGGIERFKNEEHGLDDDGNLLEQNGVIAYVTEFDFDYWFRQINSWIEYSEWDNKECLISEGFDKIGYLNSKHITRSGRNLYLNHFWIKV